MKQNRLNILVFFSIILLTLSSCDNYLDLKPESSITQEDFWQTEEQVSSGLAACYASMLESNFTNRVLKWGELRGEMLVSTNGSTDDQRMLTNNMLSSSSLVEWATFYKTINYCNMVLEFTDQAQELDLAFTKEEADNYKAQAISIRSLVYFILIKNFKEIPLVLNATSTSEVDFFPILSTETQVIDQIILDLKGNGIDEDPNKYGALEYLQPGYATSIAEDKGRFTQGAALALLADIYLWTEQYDECIDACKSIDQLEKYTLENKETWFDNIFLEGNSQESIFEIQTGVDNVVASTYYNSFFVEINDFAAYPEIIDLYTEENTVEDSRADFATYRSEDLSVWKFAGIDVTGLYRELSEFQNNYIFYRYSDIVLMEAEAQILSTSPDLERSYTLINSIHERATGSILEKNLSSGTLLDYVYIERQKEFAFEGKRWYDILRFAKRDNYAQKDIYMNPLAAFKAGSDNYEQILSYYEDPESFYLPISNTDLSRNSNIEQNPYYAN